MPDVESVTVLKVTDLSSEVPRMVSLLILINSCALFVGVITHWPTVDPVAKAA